MSVVDNCIVSAYGDSAILQTGKSLSQTLYIRPIRILVQREVEAETAALIQGLAHGLGLGPHGDRTVSALAQKWSEVLCHIDLSRLRKIQQIRAALEQAQSVPGICLIEFSAEIITTPKAGINITITGNKLSSNTIQCSFTDINIPSDMQIDKWMDEVMLPLNIRQHTLAVSDVCDRIAQELIKQGRLLRRKALKAAARAHDLMRFVSFKKSLPEEPEPTKEQTALWQKLREKYSPNHEEAGAVFLREQGFPEVGEIVRAHQGIPEEMNPESATTEQLVLAYADKRILFDQPISLDERFKYLIQRYGSGEKRQEYVERQKAMERVENWLFPDGSPF